MKIKIKSNRETARAFYAASIYYTMMKQFNPNGSLDEEVSLHSPYLFNQKIITLKKK